MKRLILIVAMALFVTVGATACDPGIGGPPTGRINVGGGGAGSW